MLFACMQESPALPTCMFLSFADAACLCVAPLVCLQVKPARILSVPDLEFCFGVFGSDPPLVVVFYPAEFTATNRLRKFPVFFSWCAIDSYLSQQFPARATIGSCLRWLLTSQKIFSSTKCLIRLGKISWKITND